MQYSFTFAALMATAGASSLAGSTKNTFYSQLFARQETSEESYIASVCTPNTTSPIPPCQEIINIEEQCQPNGTTTVDFVAHQECMCGGSFFSEWNGCQNCQYVHGARSEAVLEAFESIISTVSNLLCTGTPTASFAAIFSSVSEGAPQAISGAATTLSDQYPSDAAVSLYYTAIGSQGAGVITGTAADATATASTSGSESTTVVGPTASAGSSSTKSASATTKSSASTMASSSMTTSATTTSESSSDTTTTSASTTSATGAANGPTAVEGLVALVAVGLFAVV
ncbi:hypothetical protein BDV97DRAFT_361936 [Delphinella strobiligena]|nr:hypothetical protein BDV97DRAFT_361936 [Delphinella strobiligena]